MPFTFKWRSKIRDTIHGYLFALPWILGFLAFMLYPIGSVLLYSFCSYDVVSPPQWIFLENYQELFFKDPIFWNTVFNTLYFTGVSVPAGLMVALALALLLNRSIKGRPLFRTIFYLPAIVPIVSTAILWVWILNPQYGLLNNLLAKIGVTGPGWLASTIWSKPGIILMRIWMVGGTMIIFLAGLQDIPRQLYEVAEIDGANVWKQFLYITLPMLTPTIFFNLVINTISAFQTFTEVYIMTGGGPARSTLFLVPYLYQQGFRYFRMGYASSIATVLFLMIFICTIVILYTSSRWVYYERR